MTIEPEEFELVLKDPLTNYLLDEHTAALIDGADISPSPQPVLVLDATHIASQSIHRLVIRVPILAVAILAAEFEAMLTELRNQGAIS